MNREDLAWAAGLYEGEGSVSCYRARQKGCAKTQRHIQFRVGITDEDIARRFAAALGLRIHGPYMPDGRYAKAMWYAHTSSFEQVQNAVAKVWPWLGARRRRQAIQALQKYHEPREAITKGSVPRTKVTRAELAAR